MALRTERKRLRVINREELAERLKTQYEKLGRLVNADPTLVMTDQRTIAEIVTLTSELAIIAQSISTGKVDRRVYDETILEESRNHHHHHRHVTI